MPVRSINKTAMITWYAYAPYTWMISGVPTVIPCPLTRRPMIGLAPRYRTTAVGRVAECSTCLPPEAVSA